MGRSAGTAPGLLQRLGGLLKGIVPGHGDGDRALAEKSGEPSEPRTVRGDLNRKHRDPPLGGRRVRGDGSQPATIPHGPDGIPCA
jgi:hypothetical protein